MDKSKQNLKHIFKLNSSSTLTKDEKELIYLEIMREVKRTKLYRLIWRSASVAAVLIVCFLLTYNNLNTTTTTDIKEIAFQSKNQFVQSNTIQIASVDGDKNLDGSFSVQEKHVSDEEKIIFNSDGKSEFSTLFVPYGRRQEVVLPDGSTVWLNAGSYLTFQNNMAERDREVYLNGEGFFNIKHTGFRFTVRTQHTNINVLGTTFNTSSYEDEPYFSIDLLSGKVDLSSPTDKFKTLSMKPGERISLHIDENKIQRTYDSAGEDVLWTKKQLALKDVSMGEVLKRLERIYNIKIKADREVYDMNISYSGRLNIGVDIITSLNSIYELKDYNILLKEKEVSIIKKK